MYLIALVSGYRFGIPLHIVRKVLDVQHFIDIDGEYYIDGDPVKEMDITELLGLTKGTPGKKKAVVRLSLRSLENTALLVDDLEGFYERAKFTHLEKPAYLDHYGYGLVKSFALIDKKFVMLIDDKAVQKKMGNAV